MGVSILILNLAVILVVCTSGMTGMNVSIPAPAPVTLTVFGGIFLAFSLLVLMALLVARRTVGGFAIVDEYQSVVHRSFEFF